MVEQSTPERRLARKLMAKLIKNKDITPNFRFLLNFSIRNLLELDKHQLYGSNMNTIRSVLLKNIDTFNDIIDGKEDIRNLKGV